MATIRCLLSITADRGWKVNELDVNNIFRHRDLAKEVYMNVLASLFIPFHKVRKLVKSPIELK